MPNRPLMTFSNPNETWGSIIEGDPIGVENLEQYQFRMRFEVKLPEADNYVLPALRNDSEQFPMYFKPG